MNEIESNGLSLSELQVCKKRLFTDSPLKKNGHQETQKVQEQLTSKKRQTYVEDNSTQIKKIILKRKLKTEMIQSPYDQIKVRLKTSPNRPNVSRQKYLNFEIPVKRYEHRKYYTTLTDAYSSSLQRASIEKLTVTYTDLKPSPKKHALPIRHLSQLQQSNLLIKSPPKEIKSSREKKKIHFTVYAQKDHLKTEKNAKPSANYEIPYKFTSSITINLFDPKRSLSLQKKNQDNSSIIKKSLERLYGSNQKRQHYTKTARKPNFDQEKTLKIQRTQEKLERYKFIKEYIQKWEILQYIQELVKKQQPQCRWALLIIDKVFKKMKSQDSLENFVRK